MKNGDFTPIYDKSGNLAYRRVISIKGIEYDIGKKLGAGGVAKVFHAKKAGDAKEIYVFKEYTPRQDLLTVHTAIKRNLIRLLKEPLLDKAGNKLPHFVPPLDIIELKSGGFGYIMDKVDTDSYKSVTTIINRHQYYPDAKILCKFCKGFVDFFWSIHQKGWCYKDINEGNIFINPDNGDFWVIDCDNISTPKVKTILGTAGYMAPEIYNTNEPTTESDYFSIAAFFFRLLIGAYPMDGPASEKYMIDHDLTVDGAAPIIYGSQALFSFHPKDKRNAKYTASNNKTYRIQTKKWNALPPQIQNGMLQTFVAGLPFDKRHLRTSDIQWKRCFDDLEHNHLVLCKACKKHNFDKRKTCFSCGKDLPKAKKPKPTPKPTQKSTPIQKRYEVVFRLKQILNGTIQQQQVAFTVDEHIAGNRLHPGFASSTMLYAHYREDRHMCTVHNAGTLTWVASRDGKTAKIPPGTEIQIKTGLQIILDKSKCMLEVVGIREKR